MDWHWHNEFEIVAVSEGVVDCHVGQESFRLKAGEAVFINSRVLHQFTAKDYGIMPNIVFSPEFIAPEQTVIYDKFIAPIEKSTMEYLVFKNVPVPIHLAIIKIPCIVKIILYRKIRLPMLFRFPQIIRCQNPLHPIHPILYNIFICAPVININ